MKKFNYAMALRWMIFLPVLLVLCIVLGALEGISSMLIKMIRQMGIDIAKPETR
jgi:hypothetical protein